MKKLILLIAIALIAVSTGLSLEPTRVSVYAPQHRTIAEGGSGPATSVRVDLVNYDGGATTLYTGKVFGAGDPEVTADDNGVILVNVGASTDPHPTLGPATFADVWGDIDAANMNTSWSFDIYINGTLYSQGRIDQQIIIQANTSIFNSSGVLLPSGNPSTVGDDNNRFDALYVKQNETTDTDLEGIFIGPTGSPTFNEQLILQYDDAADEGIITANGAAIMNIDANGIDFNGKILDNVAEINDGNQALEISGAFTANQDLNVIGATPGTDARKLTITGVPRTTPFTPPFPDAFELYIDGDAKVTGYLELNGLSLLGDLNMNDNDIYAVNEIRGRGTAPVNRLLINQTNNGDVLFGNGAITSGTGQVTLGGNLDANAGVNVTGGDFTVEDNGSNFAFEVDVTSNTPASVINFGHDQNDEINFDGWVDSDIIPTPNNDLGQDDNRWRAGYFNGTLHIGLDGSHTLDQDLDIFYASNVANFQVNDPTGSQFAIDATSGSEMVTIDPAGDNTDNYTFEEAGLTVNTGANTDLVITEGTIERNNAATETLVFQNTDGANVLDVDIEGKIDVQSAASTIGDNTDNTQLTIDGLVGSNNVLVVEGNTDIDGTLNVDGNTTLQEDVDLGSATDDAISFLGRVDTNVEPIADDTYSLGSDALRWADVYVNGGSVHVGPTTGETNDTELNIGYATNAATLNVDGATNNQLTIDAGNDLVTVNASDDAIAELTIDPTDAAVGFVVNSNSTTGAEIISNASGINLDVNGDGTNNFRANNTIIQLNANDDGVTDVLIDPTGAGFTVNSNSATGNEITSNGSGIFLDPSGDGTNFSFNEGTITANTGGATDLVITEGTIGRNSGATETLDLVNTGAGVLDVNIDGKIDVQSDASTIGDGTDGLQLTIEGDVATGTIDFLVDGDTDINGTLNVDGNTTLQEDVDLGSATDDLISFAGRVDTDIVPNADNSVSLGTDALRWADVYVNGGSVHIGDANGAGAGAAELNIGWASNQATFNVNNVTRAQVTINAGSDRIVFDPAGDNDQDVYIDEGTLNINSGNVPLVITDGTVNRNNGADQTLAFGNSGLGNLNITIDGDLDVDEQITGLNTGHGLGTGGIDGIVLTINGDPNTGDDELVVDGDVQIDGLANVDGVFTATETGNSIGDGNDAVQLTILGDDAGTNNALVVEGHADIDGDLNVDGNTVHVGTLDQQGILFNSTGTNVLVEDDFSPNTTATHNLGSTTLEWTNLYLAGDANIGNNAVIDDELRLNNNAGTQYVGFKAADAGLNTQIWTLPDGDGTADQQLITDGSGNLSWGSTSLQVAYEGGNEIITDAGDGNVVIRGDQHLDVRIDLINGTAGDGAGITVDDDFTVTNGDIDFGGGEFTIVGSNGNTTTDGTLTTEGLVTANLGLNVFNANFTVGGSNFIVTPAGITTMQGLVSANAGLNVTGANFSVGGANFTVNQSNGNTDVNGTFSQSHFVGTVTSGARNENVIFTTSNVNLPDLSGYPTGSVVHIVATSGTINITGAGNTDATGVEGATVANNSGTWYIVSVGQ